MISSTRKMKTAAPMTAPDRTIATGWQLLHGLGNFCQLRIGKAGYPFLCIGSIDAVLHHDLLHIVTTEEGQ